MFYLINKRKGITSFKATKEFSKENNIKKVGHTGTLDPLATGLLLIAADDDTKLIEYIDKGSKSYIATMKIGYDSDTLDTDGKIVKVPGKFNGKSVTKAINSFVKTYNQVPPNFSAKKINGKRAYKLAREGLEVKLNSSSVTIKQIINIKKIDNETYQFEAEVSRGTYIRSLIRDIAESLGTKAIMSDLIRNKLAGFSIDNYPKQVSALELIKINIIEIKDLTDLFQGKAVKVDSPDGRYAIKYKKDIIGIVDIENKIVSKRNLFGNKYKRVLNESN